MQILTKKEFLGGEGYYSNRFELLEEPTVQIKDEDKIVNFAYTDYGDFFDKVVIEYFIDNYPNNIIWENTMFCGKNAILFGDIANEFIKETDKYLLGFQNLEDYFTVKELEEENKSFKLFLDSIEKYYDFDYQETLDWLIVEKCGYYDIVPSGVSFNYDELIDDLIYHKIIKEK